jgi:starch-binding outer membrane protein, SusD/RagB family
MKKNILLFIASAIILSGCSDLFSPEDQNNSSLDRIYEDAAFAEGLLLNGYVKLPSGSYSFNDVATDDAVTNVGTNSYLLMATGSWSSISNPMEVWTYYSAIQYLNILLEASDSVKWALTGEYTKEMFNDRMKGEAYGLRALFMYYLLQAHGGWSTDGQLLGVPILTSSSQTTKNTPRSTFEACIQQIYSDLTAAENNLPLDFEDITATSQIPTKYQNLTNISDYNRVFGAYNRQRISARIVEGIRTQVSLLAASPAFQDASNTTTWADAANNAAIVLDRINGISGLASNGAIWYSKTNSTEITAIASGVNPAEMLWRGNTSSSTSLEEDNYPPTLFGSGKVNPTQNLVDAFPTATGYPITDTNSGYDATNPYANRDPRLALYIVVNGSKEGPSSTTIYTKTGTSSTSDGLNAISTSTRTGYYMRKLLREDVNLNSTNTTTQKHYVPRIRYTEIFLDYAEAANEAWGPDGTGAHSYSARQVIAAIRNRAGIAQPDSYLASISTQDDMRTLIHNERRLELCFEGFRFWDLRRWKENILNAANGVTIDESGNYTYNSVESRAYSDYMYYGPLPYDEVSKWGLIQNAGW